MVYTFSRDMVEQGLDIVEPYVLISISTPPKFGPNRQSTYLDEDKSSVILLPDEFRLDVLRLRFDDMVTLPDLTDRQRAQYHLYSTEQANQVASFVRGWQVNIVVHCDAGISRSQGMANAISDHLDVPVKHSGPGMPNPRVYTMTWHALRPSEGTGARKRPVDPDFPLITGKLPPSALRSPDKYRIQF